MYSTQHRAVNTHRIRVSSYHSYLLLVLLWLKNKKRTQDSTTDGKSKESAKKKNKDNREAKQQDSLPKATEGKM